MWKKGLKACVGIASGCICWQDRYFQFLYALGLFDITLLFLFSFHLLLAGHVQTIDSFVSESLEILSNRPESMEEISEANSKYNQILAQKNDVS